MNERCSVCGGQVFQYLGTLGTLRHYRCRACGADCCYEVEQEEPVDELSMFTAKIVVDLNIYAATAEDAERLARDAAGWLDSSTYDYYQQVFEEDDYDPEVEFNGFTVENVIEVTA